MTSLEWLKDRQIKKHLLLTPDAEGALPFAILNPSEEPLPDDVPPAPSEEPHVLFLCYQDDKTAYYWITEEIFDSTDIDIWSEMRPSISQQLAITLPVPLTA